METIGILLAVAFMWWIFWGGVNENSTSYKLGQGTRRKVNKLGKWITDE